MWRRLYRLMGGRAQEVSPQARPRTISMTETWGCPREGCPTNWPPQHPPHRRIPRGQIPNIFYFDRLTVWTPWKASGGLSYETWEPLPCPLWPPQHPPHRRTPRGQIPNNFYFDRLTVWTPWKASWGLSYELGSPSPAPCGPHNIRHIAEHLGAKFQTTFISIFFTVWALWKATERISYFLGDPLPHLPPSGGQGRGSRGKWPGRRINRNAKRSIFCFENFSLSLVVLAVALAEYLGTPSPFCPPLGGRGGGLGGNDRGREDKPQRKKKHFLFRRLFSISCRFGCSTGRMG